ncbi:MAG: hypothetical protein IT269_08410 [Saprospiraceae bacterium]|nr:hypothetical protein [Saprospiraceae bacterium]
MISLSLIMIFHSALFSNKHFDAVNRSGKRSKSPSTAFVQGYSAGGQKSGHIIGVKNLLVLAHYCRKSVGFPILLMLLLITFECCKKTETVSPDEHQRLQELVAVADSLSEQDLNARLALLGETSRDSFYQQSIEQCYSRIDSSCIEHYISLYKMAFPNNPEVNAFCDFYNAVTYQWAGRYEAAEISYAKAFDFYSTTQNNFKKANILLARGGNMGIQGKMSQDINFKYKALEYLKLSRDSAGIFAASLMLANTLANNRDFNKALEITQEILPQMMSKDDPAGQSYGFIVQGKSFSGIKDYENALKSMGECLHIRKTANGAPQSQIFEAYYWYCKCLLDLNRIDEAIDSLQVAERLINKVTNHQLLPVFYNTLAKALQLDGQLSKAEEYAQICLQLTSKRKEMHATMSSNKILYEISKQQGRYSEALKYHEMYQIASDSIFSVEKEKTIQRLTTQFETREKEEKIVSLTRENSLSKQRNWWITGTFGLLIFGIWYTFRLKLQRKKAELMLESERFSQQAKLHEAENEHNRKRLEDYAQMLIDRNEKIAELNRQIQHENSAPEQSTAADENDFLASQIFNQSILTPEDWEKFKAHYELVFPGFMASIRFQYPEISPAELRILMLDKMGLSTRECGSVLGISQDSVKKARYRIRKKYSTLLTSSD